MRILFIARGVPDKNDPQWGSFELSQAKALKALGHEVIIASVDTRFRLYRRKLGLTTCTIDGIKTYNLFLIPGSIVHLFGEHIYDCYNEWLWHQMETVILKENEKIDIVYTHYLRNSHRAVHYLSNIHAPIVAIEHWSEVNQPTLLPCVKKMGDETYPKVARLITVSNAARQSILHHFGKDSDVVYNMVDPCFTYDAGNATEHHDRFVFTAVGNLLPIKGYDMLIHAIGKVTIPRDKWTLQIVGHGKERKHLEALISQYGLQQNIKLLGQKDKTEVQRLLSHSDAFVLASRSETFGVAYIEAMACGLPVIATRCGGPEEFVTEKVGLLVPVDDADALAKAVDYMYEHHKEYDRQAIAEDCKARFSQEVIARQLTEIFEEVVNKR